MSIILSEFSVEDETNILEDQLDSLKDALAAADTYVVQYDDIRVFEKVLTSVDGGKSYSFTDYRCVDILYSTSATDEYYSPASVAAREARAERIRQRNEDLRDAQLHRRPLTPGKPAWEGRYEKLSDGSMRLLPQFR